MEDTRRCQESPSSDINKLFRCYIMMRQGMLTQIGAPRTNYHLDIYLLSIFHYLGSPLG